MSDFPLTVSESSQSESSQKVGAAPASGPSLRQLTQWAYGLFALGVFSLGLLGAATLAGVVLAYLKRPDAVGTVYYAHFDWLLASFWWGALWLAISALTTGLYLGWLGLAATVLWLVYRLVKGGLALSEAREPLSYA